MYLLLILNITYSENFLVKIKTRAIVFHKNVSQGSYNKVKSNIMKNLHNKFASS